MKRAVSRNLVFFCSLLLAGTPAPAASAPGQAAELQDAFAQVAASVKPSVVSITAVHVESVQAAPEFFFGDPFEEFFRQFQGAPPRGPAPAPRPAERRVQGLGSGVIIDERGYVLTNEHVVRGAQELTVTIQEPEEKKYPGKVVGADPRSDLAVVKISGGPFPAARLADSEQVRVGDWAIAVGSPFGLEQTVTVGVISAVRQSLSIEGVHYGGLLQTDAAINRGNSGGPLVNIRGEVIGVNTAIYAPTGVFSGVGFAIPANRARDIMEQLIEKGRVVRGWMGVEIIPLDEALARQFRAPDGKGVLVNRVLPDSPAEKAGLKRGDVLVSFRGKKTPNPQALMDEVSRTPPKTRVPLTVARDGKPVDLFLVTGEMPQETAGGSESPDAPPSREPEAVQQEWEGARLVPASPELARRYGFPEKEAGAVVLSVASGGLAERAGLAEGDLVASVNRERVADAAGFVKAVKKADLRQGLVLDVYRRGKWIYVSFQEPS